MHANRILLPLLILASLAVDTVLAGLLSQRTWPDVLVAILLGLAGGQINLAALWAVLGYRHLPWRIAVLLVVPIAWSFAIVASAPQILTGYRMAATWAVHFLTQTALFASFLALVRLAGSRLLQDELPPARRKLRLQFTLRFLFAWLTSTAIALSVLKTTFEHARLAQTHFEWEAILILGFVNAMLGLISLWLILDRRSLSRRIAAAVITALPVACIVGYLVTAAVDADRFLAVLLLWLVAASYSGAASIVLRIAGFRLTSLAARNPVADPAQPD